MTLHPDTFEQYLQNVQSIKMRIDNDLPTENLLEFIQVHSQQSGSDSTYKAFFDGESSFYQGLYEQALKHYLQAKSIPHFHFFCYRASSFVANKNQLFDKAINFSKKALKIRPYDYMLLQMCAQSLAAFLSPDEFKSIQKALSELDHQTSQYAQAQIIQEAQSPAYTHAASHETSLADTATVFQEPISQHAEHSEIPHLLEKREAFHVPHCNETTAMSSQAYTLPTPLSTLLSSAQPNRPYQESVPTPPETIPMPSAAEKSSPLLKDPKKMRLPEADIFSEIHLPEMPLPSAGHTESENMPEKALEMRVKAFQKYKSALVAQYVGQSHNRAQLNDNSLLVLNGWNYQQTLDNRHKTEATYDAPSEAASEGNSFISRFLLTEQSRKTSGGFYLRWQGKGVVINPGANFLDNFHQYGMHIKDIDYVIVSKDAEDAYLDVKGIYDLNYQLNSANSELHIIHYYLNQKAFLQIGGTLKPNFKQEKNTVHCLELYLDSPDVEKVELTEWMALNYFPISAQEALHHQNSAAKEDRSTQIYSSLGLRLDLKQPEDVTASEQAKKGRLVTIGYISGTAWSPLISHHMGSSCDILITGFENTNSQDYEKQTYNDDCLGYHGIYSLMEEISPRLLLCCEFGGREGDIRVELVKKLRQEQTSEMVAERQSPALLPVVLPGDTGLFIDLKTLQIQCSVSKTLVDPAQVHVVKSVDAFGNLRYLSPNCYL